MPIYINDTNTPLRKINDNIHQIKINDKVVFDDTITDSITIGQKGIEARESAGWGDRVSYYYQLVINAVKSRADGLSVSDSLSVRVRKYRFNTGLAEPIYGFYEQYKISDENFYDLNNFYIPNGYFFRRNSDKDFYNIRLDFSNGKTFYFTNKREWYYNTEFLSSYYSDDNGNTWNKFDHTFDYEDIVVSESSYYENS